MNFRDRLKKLQSEVQALKTVRPRVGSLVGTTTREVNVTLKIKGWIEDVGSEYEHKSRWANSALVYFDGAKWGDEDTMIAFAIEPTNGRIFDISVSVRQDSDNFENSDMAIMLYCMRGNSSDEAELGGDASRTKDVNVKLLVYSTKQLGTTRIIYNEQ